MALGSNGTGNNPSPISSCGACGWSLGDRAGAKFQGGHLTSLLSLVGGRAELWALSLARQKLKEVSF